MATAPVPIHEHWACWRAYPSSVSCGRRVPRRTVWCAVGPHRQLCRGGILHHRACPLYQYMPPQLRGLTIIVGSMLDGLGRTPRGASPSACSSSRPRPRAGALWPLVPESPQEIERPTPRGRCACLAQGGGGLQTLRESLAAHAKRAVARGCRHSSWWASRSRAKVSVSHYVARGFNSATALRHRRCSLPCFPMSPA